MYKRKLFIYLICIGIVLVTMTSCTSHQTSKNSNKEDAQNITNNTEETTTIISEESVPNSEMPTVTPETVPSETEPTEPTETEPSQIGTAKPIPSNPPAETEGTQETIIIPPTVIEKPKYEPTKEDFTLIGSFGFYKGSKSISDIKEIYFQHEVPEEYDETWNAGSTDKEYITGYRKGDKVYIVGEKIFANRRCNYMFATENSYGDKLWSSLEKIYGLENIDMSNATNMRYMFNESKMKEISGIENWNTSSVTSMEMMFSGCVNLKTLDVANWDVSNVNSFAGMFQGHSWEGDMNLEHIDVSKWNTSSATEMNHVFYGCSKLKQIAIDDWDVSKVKTFSHMFADCYGLENLNFSKWNTASVISFDAFLNDCHSLITIDVSGLDTKTCKQFSQMFEACTNLEYIIGIETWDVSNAEYYAFSETFHCCNKLKELNIGNWKCKPDNIARMFKNCYELKYVDMSGFDMSELKYVTEFATHCKQLSEINGIENWDMSIFTEESMAFEDCPLIIQK